MSRSPDADHSPLATRHSPLWYWLSLAAFVLAMLSKGSVAMLPVLILGILWWLRPLTRRDLLRSLPFFAVAVVFTCVNLWFQTHISEEAFREASFTERLLAAGGVVWFYLYKAILPLDLAFVYPKWHVQAGNPLWWLPLLAAVSVTAVLWRHRAGRGRPFLFAWGFFCVGLVPVLGFTDVGFMQYSLVADHYQHIAIIGVIALAAAGWGMFYRQPATTSHLAAAALAVLTVVALAWLTWRQNTLYGNAINLYEVTLEKNPQSWVAHYNLANELVKSGRPKQLSRISRKLFGSIRATSGPTITWASRSPV